MRLEYVSKWCADCNRYHVTVANATRQKRLEEFAVWE